MATTTYGTTETRNNNALYWGIAVVLFLVVVAFFSLRPRSTVETVSPAAPSNMEAAPASSKVNGGAASMSTETNTSNTTTTTTPADESTINTNKEVEAEKATDSQAQ